MKFRKKKLEAQQLEAILNSLGYNETTWAERVEHTRDEFLEIVYNRMKRVLSGSLNEMLRMSYYGKLFKENTKELTDWLNDDKINPDVVNGLNGSLFSLVSHYTNLASIIDVRLSIKDVEGEMVYLTYNPPPEVKGLADVVYVYLNREVYDSINKYLGEVKVNDDVNGMFL